MLFKGTFNWYCEIHILYTRAGNKELAFSNFITQLSKRLERNRGSISIYFLKEHPDNWLIKEEKED